MKRRVLIFATVALVVLAGAGIVLFFIGDSPVEASGESEKPQTKAIRTVKPTLGGHKTGSESRPQNSFLGQFAKRASKSADDDEKMSPEHRKIADDLQAALDREDFKATQRATELAIASKNPKLLKRAVEACKWFGSKSLAELTSIAAACAQGSAEASGNSDTDAGEESSSDDGEDLQTEFEEAEQLAFEGIEEKLGEIENDAEKATLVREYMKATSDADMLTLLEGQLNTVLDEKLAIDAAIDVIENGSAAAAEHAKAVYEFQTSETYTGREAAQQWLNENYTPPDAD